MESELMVCWVRRVIAQLHTSRTVQCVRMCVMSVCARARECDEGKVEPLVSY